MMTGFYFQGQLQCDKYLLPIIYNYLEIFQSEEVQTTSENF